jgi:hypothetical protein
MKRAVAPEPAEPVCEVCAADGQLTRYRGETGLLVCVGCVQMKPAELAVAYGRRLRKAAERAK